MSSSGEWTTTDLGLASLLYALGVEYKGIKKQEGTWQKMLAFSHPPAEYLAGWQSGNIEVKAQAYWQASRKLKHELMQARDS